MWCSHNSSRSNNKKGAKNNKKHETLKHCNFEHQFLLLLFLQVSSINTSFRSPKSHIPEVCFIKCVLVVDNVPNPAVFIRFSVTKITLFSLFFGYNFVFSKIVTLKKQFGNVHNRLQWVPPCCSSFKEFE